MKSVDICVGRSKGLLLSKLQSSFADFDLLQACWQPSCSTVDHCFNGARFQSELLSRNVVKNNCTTNDLNAVLLHLNKKKRQKNNTVLRVVTEGAK